MIQYLEQIEYHKGMLRKGMKPESLTRLERTDKEGLQG